jgi:hypothetical protein
MTLISKKKQIYFCNRLFIYFTIIKTFYPFWIFIFLIYRQEFKMVFFLYYWTKVPMTICILISYVLTNFKEMPGRKLVGPAETDIV